MLKFILKFAIAVNFILLAVYFLAVPKIDNIAAASINGSARSVQKILRSIQVNPNQRLSIGETPLFYAMTYGYTDVVKAFIDGGADPNTKSSFGESPLMTATYYRRSEIIKLLIERGADVNIQDKDGYTPLIWAARFGLSSQLKLLIESGANLNLKSKYGFTALYSSVAMKNTAESLQLLKAGADPNQVDAWGLSPLHLAIFFGNQAAYQALLKNPSIHLEQKNVLGKTPLDFALARQDWMAVDLLLAQNANLSDFDSLGQSPRMKLALSGYPSEKISLEPETCRQKKFIERAQLQKYCRH
jgi:uncharacterized protein